MVPPFSQLLKPKTLKLSSVSLILSQSTLIHQQILLAIHWKTHSPFHQLPPLPPHTALTAFQLLWLCRSCPGRLLCPYLFCQRSQITPHPAHNPFPASQDKNKSQGLNHYLQRPCMIWPLAPPAFGPPLSLFFDMSGMLQPESVHVLFREPRCPHSYALTTVRSQRARPNHPT